MAKFVFYTDEGNCISPNDHDVENLQILGFEDGKNPVEALKKLHKNNSWIKEYGFSDDNFCRVVFSPEIVLEINKLLDYLWVDMERHYEESRNDDGSPCENHIFETMQKIRAEL